MTESERFLPPRQHPLDPPKAESDPMLSVINRLQTLLIWSDEHLTSFDRLRQSDPDTAERELGFLKNSIEQTILHFQQLSEFLADGYTLDSDKQKRKELFGEVWMRLVEAIRKEHCPQ